ncbi:MAG TPA: hypothetical protein VGJ05_07305 [Fimbriiglobus sp.]|jgi:hypothetical protein
MDRQSPAITFSSRKFRRHGLIGFAILGLAAIGSPGKSLGWKSGQQEVERSADANKLPLELETLNVASRKMYADARTRELSTIPVVIIVSGDDLVLRKNGKRTVATTLPAEYHALKCVAHSTLALFTHLSFEPGKPIGAERSKTLADYRALLTAARPAVEKCGLGPASRDRQMRILDRALAFADKVMRDGQVSENDLAMFCRSERSDVMANGADAVTAQLSATHKQVMAWKADMTAEEWAGLRVIVCGGQTPRSENAAVQYFSRVLGEARGEGRRVVYAESLWDEEKAVNLLGTLRLDGKLSVAMFGDPYRLYRDLLADSARRAIDDILAPPVQK